MGHVVALRVLRRSVMIHLAAFLIGLIAGLRSMTALAGVSWSAHFGGLALGGTRLAFVGSWYSLVIATLLALAELVTDQLPKTPSRKKPGPFGFRVASGA